MRSTQKYLIFYQGFTFKFYFYISILIKVHTHTQVTFSSKARMLKLVCSFFSFQAYTLNNQHHHDEFLMIVPEKRYLSNGGDKISEESLKFTMQ